MYAIAILLGLVVLIALVYLPRIRRPSLWVLISTIALGILGVGGWWAKTKYEERRDARLRRRELSYLVDHVIGTPRDCPARPFPATTSRFTDPMTDPLEEYLARKAPATKGRAPGEMTDEEMVGAPTAAKGLTDEEMAGAPAPAAKGFTDDEVAAMSAAAAKPGFVRQAPDPFGARLAELKAADCNASIDALSKLIREHSTDLNEFIQDNQSDPRVDAVQGALLIHGLWWKKTCKNLRDEKMDDYELHQQGCK